MESLFTYVAPPSQCGYLPEQTWQLEYEIVAAISPAEYLQRMEAGWRRFGNMLFRPRCPACAACQSLRVVARRFRPDRSQRRARKANEGVVTLRIRAPEVTAAKLQLYDKYHAFQSDAKGWPQHPAKDAESYVASFVKNPFPIDEWCYYVSERLIGVGYVDRLAGGLSAIYFFYDPDERDRCLGTWNVLQIIEHARKRRIPFVYLGYFVAGSASLAYKGRFLPNELRGVDGVWRDFRA